MSYQPGRKAGRRASQRTKRPLAWVSGASLLVLATSAWAADSAASITEVVVTAPRKETEARKVQMEAPNLISVQSAETMAKYPDFNAAESLSRMPGISLSSDTGEGRFVNIRGIDGNLDGATFSGVPLLNTFPGGTSFGAGGRAVEFDTIPGGSIDGIVVTYTGLPDHEAEGLGGSVELTPRTAANISHPFVDATLGWGYEPMHDHTGPFNADGAVGARFGFNNGHLVIEGVDAPTAAPGGFITNPTPFSFVLTASTQSDRRGFDDIEEDYNNPGTSDRSYQDIQFRNYDYHRTRDGYGGEFDFTPNDDHRYYLRGNAAGYTEAVKKNFLTYNFGDSTETSNGGFTAPAQTTVSSTDEQETHRNQVFVAGGQDKFGDVLVDYRASYSTASYDQTKNYGATFNGPMFASFYDNTANNGDFPVVGVTDGTNINNASLYNLRKGQVANSQEHDYDQEYAFAGNVVFPVHLLNDDDRVKMGFEVRLRNKTQKVFNEEIDVGDLNLAGVSTAAITNFYDRGYTNGPNINTIAVRDIAQAVEGPNVFDPTGYFRAREDIYSGYAQYTATVGKLGILAGVRVEATDANYANFVFNGDGNLTGFVNNPQSYTNVFPTVQLRYNVMPNLVARATYSTGIGRPGFNQVAGAVTIDTSNGIITSGNPKLQPTTGNNFDLDIEYYLPKGGIVQLDLFDKEFSNYIVTRNSFEASDPRIPDFPTQIRLVSFANVPSAYARGIQAAYHQQFVWLPDPFNGFGIESNLTVVDSRFQEYNALTSGTGQAEYGYLPGTSRFTANFAGFYEAHGVEARLSGQYVGAELFSLGGSKASDTIQDNRLTLDFGSAYNFTKNWKVYFNVKNLLNTPLRFYIGNPSFPIQREFYDVTYEAGVKVHF